MTTKTADRAAERRTRTPEENIVMKSRTFEETRLRPLEEALARAQMSERLGEAQARRLGQQAMAAQKLSRKLAKAEQQAASARLALARLLA